MRWQNNYAIKRFLQGQNLHLKIMGLVGVAMLLFVSNIFIVVTTIKYHFIFIAGISLLLNLLCYTVLEFRSYKTMLRLWMVGTVIYFLFAVPRIYFGGVLTPHLQLAGIYERWIYSLMLPFMLLGTFSAGLVFVRIVAPTEFLRWGRLGLKMALLFRVLQHTGQQIQITKRALMMQNLWIDECSKFKFKNTWMAIKFSPILVGTVMRNIILYWFPWGWICFNQMQAKIFQENT